MARTPSIAAAASLLILAVPAAGQAGTTIPSSLNGIEGGVGSSIPFGLDQPIRYQVIYDAVELPWTGPRVITRVSLRADNDQPLTTTFAAKGFVVVSMSMSTSWVTSANASQVFDDNHGPDRRLVIDRVPMMLPAQPAMAGVRPANIDLTLTQPWAYGLVPVRHDEPPPTSLVIELLIHSQLAGAYRIDGLGTCTAASTAFGNAGPLCAGPAGVLQIDSGPSMLAGGDYSWVVTNAPPNAPVFLLMSLAASGFLFGNPATPVPFALFDPANPTQPPPLLAQALGMRFGAPDCWINIVPAGVLMAGADTGGTASFTLRLPAGRQLVGLSFFTQAAAYSQTANPLLMILSQGRQSTICGPLGVTRIYSFGNVAAPSGQLSRGQGPILELF